MQNRKRVRSWFLVCALLGLLVLLFLPLACREDGSAEEVPRLAPVFVTRVDSSETKAQERDSILAHMSAIDGKVRRMVSEDSVFRACRSKLWEFEDTDVLRRHAERDYGVGDSVSAPIAENAEKLARGIREDCASILDRKLPPETYDRQVLQRALRYKREDTGPAGPFLFIPFAELLIVLFE